jgi:UDP:flavonoid glycosyltransferase YjiC (YdhE family)
MKTALFLMFPAIGHLNASFFLARQLKQCQYRVAYAGLGEEPAQVVKAQGFDFYPLKVPLFGLGQEKLLRTKNGNLDYLDEMLARASGRLYRERKTELSQLVDKLKPGVVFIDSHASTDFIVLYHYWNEDKIKLVFLSTMLPDRAGSGFPPMFSPRLPSRNWGNRLAISASWLGYGLTKSLGDLVDWCKYLGKGDAAIRTKYFRYNQIPQKHRFVRGRTTGLLFANVAEWVLAPQHLQFTGQFYTPYQYYLGLCVDENRRRSGCSPEIGQLITKLTTLRTNNPETKIIYASFGTRQQHNPAIIIAFLEKMADIFSYKPDWYLIISTNRSYWPRLASLPNIIVLEQAPQLELLSVADLFITHAGLNSIKEAIFYQVPMLCYPLETIGDQQGNAARVIHHSLGLRGDIVKDTTPTILQKTEKLLTGANFKREISEFKEVCLDQSSRISIEDLLKGKPTVKEKT